MNDGVNSMLTEEQTALVENNTRLISLCLRRLDGIARGDAAISYEDLWQIGAVGLVEAARSHNPHKGAFSTFACLCINRKFIDYINAMRRDKRKGNVNALRLDAPIVSDESCTVTYADVIAASDDTENVAINAVVTSDLAKEINRVLSLHEQQVFFMRLEDIPFSKIAEILSLGKSKQAAHIVYKRAKTKLASVNALRCWEDVTENA